MELLETEALPDPIEQFVQWRDEAREAGEPQTSHIALATASKDGRPSVRFLTLCSVDERGFVFYTNYASLKAREIDDNPRGSFALHWPVSERQVRVGGAVERISSEESDSHFHTRPRESRLETWASPQGRVIEGRPWLEARWRKFEAEFGDAVPRPGWWGGYRLVPDVVEYWQQRPHRMHDRLEYRKEAGVWTIRRLAP